MKILSYIVALSAFFIACNEQRPAIPISHSNPVAIDSQPGECPYLTHDWQGNNVISWVRTDVAGKTAFCYSVSGDKETFPAPTVIPNTGNIQPHGENMPKIIFKSDNDIIALWGEANPNPKNKYSGRVYYSQSFDKGQNWTSPSPLTSDTASFDQRYYDVALLPSGEVGAIWLDNPNDPALPGSNLYFASTNGKNGFSEPRAISRSCCQCCRTVLYLDKESNVHALFRGIIQDSIRDMVHMVSRDGGKTFSQPKRISDDNWVINACPHTGPAMTENQNGLHFAWFTGGKNKGCYYTNSINLGDSFKPRDSVSIMGSHPQIASLTDGNLLITWDESRTTDTVIRKLIGVQLRNKDGEVLAKEYLTNENGEASFPMISESKAGTCMIAYTRKKDGKNIIEYQVLNVKGKAL